MGTVSLLTSVEIYITLKFVIKPHVMLKCAILDTRKHASFT